jgi:hypothetical protein
LNIPEYIIFRCDRNSKGGGVATFVKETWSPVDLREKYVADGLEATLVRITVQKPTKHIILVSIYRPPNLPITWFDKLNTLLLELMPLGLLVILGDINADLLTPHASAPKLLRKSLKLAGLSVPTIKPTRVSATTSTCLDLIGIPNELECIDYSVLINGTSDHYPIQAVLKACTDVKPCPVRKRSFKRVNMAELSRKVSAIALDPSNLCTADNLL